MPRYSEQFKRDAVALYENNEDLSLHAASAELGVNRSSLFSWLQQHGPGKRARTKAMRDNAKETTDSERIRGLSGGALAARGHSAQLAHRTVLAHDGHFQRAVCHVHCFEAKPLTNDLVLHALLQGKERCPARL